MIYQQFWKQRSIPTWLGILISLIGLTVGVHFVQRPQLKTSQAAPETKPQQIQISNITEKSFTVSWVTAEPATGFLSYGENSQTKYVARDIRDEISGDLKSMYTHWVSVTGLKPNRVYSFIIKSADLSYDNNGSPFVVTTAPHTSEKQINSSITELQGQVFTSDGQPGADAIIYLRADNLSPLSTLVNLSGDWSINLTQARTSDLTQAFQFGKEFQTLEIFVHGGQYPSSNILFTDKNSQPLPKIILGKNYDFRASENNGQELTDSKMLIPVIAQGSSYEQEITISASPPNQTYHTRYPIFFGKSTPMASLNVDIDQNPEYTSQIVADKDGNWQWVFENSLKAGPHSFTISPALDTQGLNKQTIQFLIQLNKAPGLGLTSPSPSPSVVTPDVSLTPVPQTTSEPTDEIMSKVKAEHTSLSINDYPTFVNPAKPTPLPATPASEISLPTVGFIGVGLILTGIGIILVL